MCASREEQTEAYPSRKGRPSGFTMPNPQAQDLNSEDHRGMALKAPTDPSASHLCPCLADSLICPCGLQTRLPSQGSQ